MREEPAQPELVEVILVQITTNSGRTIDFAIRADNGDSIQDDGDSVTYSFGKTGETTRVAKSQIAIHSSVTRKVPKTMFKDKDADPKSAGVKLQ
jgi:hypothetical protein